MPSKRGTSNFILWCVAGTEGTGNGRVVVEGKKMGKDGGGVHRVSDSWFAWCQ